MNRALAATVVLLGCSCSSDNKTKTQADCDAIASQIRTEAPQHGFAASGVCSNPAAQKDFGQACADLKDCNDHCCK